jgi:hypothetical protein
MVLLGHAQYRFRRSASRLPAMKGNVENKVGYAGEITSFRAYHYGLHSFNENYMTRAKRTEKVCIQAKSTPLPSFGRRNARNSVPSEYEYQVFRYESVRLTITAS